jgi:hypothetical protein
MELPHLSSFNRGQIEVGEAGFFPVEATLSMGLTPEKNWRRSL